MQDKTLVRKWQNVLLRKENDLVRDAMLYCSKHELDFNHEHKKLLKCALRKFFKLGVVPILRDLYEDNVKDYPHEEPKK